MNYRSPDGLVLLTVTAEEGSQCMRLHEVDDVKNLLSTSIQPFGKGGETINGCCWFPGMNLNGKIEFSNP